jgi:hypothetical protein
MIQSFFFTAPASRMRYTERAIIKSSSVQMTRTLTRLVSVEIKAAIAANDWVVPAFRLHSMPEKSTQCADRWSVLGNPAGEYEGIHTIECGGEGVDSFFA